MKPTSLIEKKCSSGEAEAKDVEKNENEEPTETSTPAFKREPTDVFFLISFSPLFVAWLGAIVYVVSTNPLYEHQLDNCARYEHNVTLKLQCEVKLDQDHSSSFFFDPLAFTLTILTLLTLAYVQSTLTRAYYYICNGLMKTSDDRDEVRSYRWLITVGSFFVVANVNVMLHFCTANPMTYGQLLWTLLVLNFAVVGFSLGLYTARSYSYKRALCLRILRFCPGTGIFVLSIAALVALVIATATSAIQFTDPSDPLRYFIGMGCFWVCEFCVCYANSVLALVTAAYRGAPGTEAIRGSHAFAYAAIVTRYHLGSVILSAMDVLQSTRAFFIVLRRDCVTTPYTHERFQEILYRVYLTFHGSSQADVLVVKSGANHSTATRRTIELLLANCTTSPNVLNYVVYDIVKVSISMALLTKAAVPVLQIGFGVFELSPLASDLSVWMWICGLASYAYFTRFFVMLIATPTIASRLCILDDLVGGRTQKNLTDEEYDVACDV